VSERESTSIYHTNLTVIWRPRHIRSSRLALHQFTPDETRENQQHPRNSDTHLPTNNNNNKPQKALLQTDKTGTPDAEAEPRQEGARRDQTTLRRDPLAPRIRGQQPIPDRQDQVCSLVGLCVPERQLSHGDRHSERPRIQSPPSV
jgi:hypothetical protein